MKKKVIVSAIIGTTVVAIIATGFVYLQSKQKLADEVAMQNHQVQVQAEIVAKEMQDKKIKDIQVEEDGTVTAIIDGEAFAGTPEEETSTPEEETSTPEVPLEEVVKAAEAITNNEPIPPVKDNTKPTPPPAPPKKEEVHQEKPAPQPPTTNEENKPNVWQGEDPFADTPLYDEGNVIHGVGEVVIPDASKDVRWQ